MNRLNLHARSRPTAAAVVLALHGLLAAAWLQLGAWKDSLPAPPGQAPLRVWLLDTRPPPAAPRSTAPAPAAQARRSVVTTPVAAPLPAAPTAITLPAAPTLEPTPAPPVSAPTVATPAPLNLALPRGASAPWRQGNPALDDPRTVSARPTLESRIAAALGGSDQITEEPLGDGRIRMRRGKGCVVVHPNRAQTLDPFNASVFPKPRSVEKC